MIKEEELIVRNLNYSDAGPYTCAARNILGSSEAISNLTVRGKTNTVLLLFLGFFVFRECENTRFEYINGAVVLSCSFISSFILIHPFF